MCVTEERTEIFEVLVRGHEGMPVLREGSAVHLLASGLVSTDLAWLELSRGAWLVGAGRMLEWSGGTSGWSGGGVAPGGWWDHAGGGW